MARGRRLLLPASRAGGRQRLARHRAWPAWVAGRGPGLPVTGRPRRSGEGQRAGHLSGRCAAAVPAYPPRRQPSGEGGGTQGADKLLRFRSSSPRPVVTAASHPGSRSRHSARPRDAVNQRMEGRGRVPQPVYLACTCGVLPWTWPRNSRPAANLTAPAPGAPGSRPGPGRCPPGPGHCQVRGRSTPGRREVCGRAARGPSQVCARSMAAGCMGFRTRPLPVTRSPPCVMTPGPAARPAGQETASQSRRACWPPRSPAAPRSARWIPRTRPSGR